MEEKLQEGAVVRADRIPVSADLLRRCAIRPACEKILHQVQEELGWMQRSLADKVYCLAEKGRPVLIPLMAGENILWTDPNRAKLRIHDSYRHSYGYNILTEAKDIPEDFSLSPCTKKHIQKHRKFFGLLLSKRPAAKYLKEHDIYGMTHPTEKDTPDFASLHSENNYGSFGCYGHLMVVDFPMQRIKLPAGASLLSWELQQGTVLEVLPYGLKDQVEMPQEEIRWLNHTLRLLAGAVQKQILSITEVKDGMFSVQLTENAAKVVEAELNAGRPVSLPKAEINEELVRSCIPEVRELTQEEAHIAIEELRKQDFIRANMTEYDVKQFEDPNRGSWELYDDGDMASLPSSVPLYARDPRADIQQGGVIGIDFGTRSTVVVRMGNNRMIRPLRIGSGRIEKAPTAADYENPTVVHFVNLEQFFRAYQARAGRPFTSWADLTVSHTAYETWKNNENSDNYFSFFGELKQWAGSPDHRVRIRDAAGKELDLKPYMQLQDSDMDPIELYAYYIGLYINNQHMGGICTDYLLSFPVTYERAVRDRILESFRRGLRHSLPNAVLNDPRCMEEFEVKEGVGEPAAYAVCALQEFDLRPAEGEKIVYGIFDFGGGTTDFDFGIWRKANREEKKHRYHYAIQHFGSGGDKFLGGENLLEGMAYSVFKANRDKLRKDNITFSKPLDPWYKAFPGSEYLISDSQEARSNMQQLVEALRPYWEHSEGEKTLVGDSGILKVRLFDRDGGVRENYELTVDISALDKLLEERIHQGVNEFFSAFDKACEDHAPEMKGGKKLNIFLAGNSSRSPVLQEIFKEEIAGRTEEAQSDPDGVGEKLDCFELYYPLGTKEADEKRGHSEQDELERPTGKTGVAIGLVQCRSSGPIKVIDEVPTNSEIRFKFTLGVEDEDGYFERFFPRETEYNQWVEYLDAGVKDFEFLYSAMPSAELPRALEADRVFQCRQRIPAAAVNEDWMIYLRCVSPNEVEYTVAESPEAANAGHYQMEPRKIKLSEGE